jgi:hypothetical protein
MGRSRTEKVAASFWQRAGGREQFGSPVNIGAASEKVLPVSVVPVTDLDTSAIGKILGRIGAAAWHDNSPRALRGCLIADAGAAIILVEANDSAEEQRFTVAHEVAHLILHYLGPREDAVMALGSGIIPVLDRMRPPTFGERLSAALRNFPMEPFQHAMDRTQRHTERIEAIEAEADDLGVELIAPWRELQAGGILTPGAIRERFGLPPLVAAKLAAMISLPRTSVGVLGIFAKK